MGERPVADLISDLADRLGPEEFTAVCVDLMRGAPREDHLDALPTLAGHDLPRVRAAAMRALGVAGDTEHVAVVQDHLDDPDPAVRRSAARSLERMTKRLDLA